MAAPGIASVDAGMRSHRRYDTGAGPGRRLEQAFRNVTADGSSTVGPLTQAVAEEFNAKAPNVQISVDISGTGGGFKRFCVGETDVQDASRPIKDEEAKTCADNGVEWYEFEVAYDGITIVTNKENTWLTCITTADLKKLWQKENPANTWADLNQTTRRTPLPFMGLAPTPERSTSSWRLFSAGAISARTSPRVRTTMCSSKVSRATSMLWDTLVSPTTKRTRIR